MDRINTVTGTVGADQLGTVLTHEHVFVVQEDFRLNYLHDWDEDAQIDNAVATLTRLKESGVDTIMDVSVLGIGRNVERVAEVARQVELNIIAATGLFTFNDLPFQFHYTGPGLGFDVTDPLDEMFLRDLTRGIGATSIKAGFLVCVIEAEGLTPGVERVMRSVGRVAAQTGVAVVVHTNPHTKSGLIAQRVLAEEGADLTRVILAHSGDTTDLDYLMRVADAGSVLGLDRFGLDVLLPYADRIDTLVALVERGYSDRIVLSQDAFCSSDWFDQTAMLQVAPDWDYFQVTGRVVPELRARGVSETAIDSVLSGVPNRLLTPAAVDLPKPGAARVSSLQTGLSPNNHA
ncbi:phosphotriesterase family protein [Gordonia zhaorongruii]|uniref:phosphotriesterase family protein n=1 Tax=Gordonia zhaorongruii TaxID=2597659 RepID=UPI00104642C1|nr:phosphotriesterase [Gordonia zhaorongruii]